MTGRHTGPAAAPRLEPRRADDFERELRARAGAWLPDWSRDAAAPDFGAALLTIAARFGSEVAERLDRAGDKMALGLLDWLGLKAQGARAARIPVAFRLAETALEPVRAAAPVRLQADAGGATVPFETETDLMIVPGSIAMIVGADPAGDRFFLAPPGLASLEREEPAPVRWRLKTFAAEGAALLQLDPAAGLAEGMFIAIAGAQYEVVEAKGDLVTITPRSPAGGLQEGTIVDRASAFRPFDYARNRQEHALYIGDPDLFELEAAGIIEIAGLPGLPSDGGWEYWGKCGGSDVAWQPVKATPDPGTDHLILEKPAGAIELVEVNGREARWLRTRSTGSESMMSADGVTVRINPLRSGKTDAPEAITKPVWHDLLRPEVFVNTTASAPSQFYPLGREPRMFDTLYLGSPEAFSKGGASVWVRLELADATMAGLAAINLLPSRWVVAGMRKDGALAAFVFDTEAGTLTRSEVLDPRRPERTNSGGASVQLVVTPGWPPAIWRTSGETSAFQVAACSNEEVWAWEPSDGAVAKWRPYNSVPPNDAIPGGIVGVIHLPAGAVGGTARLIALRGGRLFTKPDNAAADPWTELETQEGTNVVEFATLAPILSAVGTSGPLLADVQNGLVGVSTDNRLYRIDVATGDCTLLLDGDVSTHVRPAAALEASGDVVVVAARQSAAALIVNDNSPSTAPRETLPLTGPPTHAVAVTLASGALHFFAMVNGAGGAALVQWPTPRAGQSALPPIPLPATLGAANGPPLVLPGHLLVPGQRADVFIGKLDLANRVSRSARIKPGLLMPPTSAPALLIGDCVALIGSGTPALRTITENGVTREGNTLYPLDAALDSGAPPVAAWRATGTARVGAIDTTDATALGQFELAGSDSSDTQRDDWLLIDGTLRQVTGFVLGSSPRVASITPPFDATTQAGPASYFRPEITNGRPASFMELDPGGNGDWDARLLDRAPIVFPGSPRVQVNGTAFRTDASNRPELIVLSQPIAPTAAVVPFTIDAAVGEWTRALGDTATNPELAWEYWNGASWLRLPVADGTAHLRNSGTVSFTVPVDLAPVEWAGKSSHWVRARLIGGDYGRETVNVVTKPGPGAGETTQTVVRTNEGLQPPLVLDVGVAYALGTASVPRFVMTLDSGMWRDQSDANRTPGVEIEMFTPLSVMLGRLEGKAGATAAEAPECPCECDCGEAPSTAIMPASAAAAAPSGAEFLAIYLGLTGKIAGAPVNLLFEVAEERAWDELAPLRVDALVGSRFVPLVRSDETRGLAESGLVRMSVPIEPSRAGLFGSGALSWLRITPARPDPAWKPALAGIFLNAVWARAAETMTRELVGASSGEPNLTLALARPPVLAGTLELRVREPLGQEERSRLLADDREAVESAVEDLPGDWVRWREVPEPLDCAAGERVYALDEATGTVRFGDGRHGLIPPAGRDAIVAFRYERADAGSAGAVPANRLRARDELNLVSAVQSVETVRAAGAAAGGVPPETPAQVASFAPARLWHRGRAVSAADFESLALERSAEAVQARCFVRGGRVRLVVVMRGSTPAPSQAQRRELWRALLEAASPALAAPGALTIEGPRVRRLGIELVLGVDKLDAAGAIAEAAAAMAAARFDSETGEEAGTGWPMGANPREEDVAAALVDLPGLTSISCVRLIEVAADGSRRLWPDHLRANELAVLAEGGVRVDVTTTEPAA